MPDINLNIEGGLASHTDEQIRDLIANAIAGGTDIDVTHDDANDTITFDFTGTNYTAEAARDDVAAALGGGSGISVTHNDGADTITINTSALLDGQNFDGQGTSQLSNVQSIDTERLSNGSGNLRIAAPGEVQSKIDDVNATGEKGAVWLIPEQTYDWGSELHVKTGVRLYFNGALYKPTSDLSNHIYVDADAHLVEAQIDTTGITMTDSNTVVLVDTDRSTATGKTHRTGQDSAITVDVRMLGAPDEGTGVKLVADGTNGGGGISMGNHLNFDIYGYDRPVHLETVSGGYLQGAECNWTITNGRIQIDWTSSDATGQFNQPIYGTLQPESPETDTAIRNDVGNNGPHFYGDIQDPVDYASNIFIGPNIQNTGFLNDDISGRTDGSGGQYQIIYDPNNHRVIYHNLTTDDSWRQDYGSGNLAYYLNGTQHLQLNSRGDIIPKSPDGFIRYEQEDLTSRTPVASIGGEMAYHDGTGTPSKSLCFATDGNAWYNIVDGNTF